MTRPQSERITAFISTIMCHWGIMSLIGANAYIKNYLAEEFGLEEGYLGNLLMK